MDGLQLNSNIFEPVWGNNKFEYIDKVKEKRTLVELIDMLNEGINDFEENRSLFIGVSKFMSRALEYIELNYYKDITLDDLSNHVGLSKSYLSSTFKKVVGDNFIDYLIQHRLNKAKQLLEQTDLKISEIAGKIGFNDPKYFAKLFKRLYGITPTEFREQKCNEIVV
jgi:two-component system response regulator YesN